MRSQMVIPWDETCCFFFFGCWVGKDGASSQSWWVWMEWDCWWFVRNPAVAPVEGTVVYPAHYLRQFYIYIPGGAGFLPSTGWMYPDVSNLKLTSVLNNIRLDIPPIPCSVILAGRTTNDGQLRFAVHDPPIHPSIARPRPSCPDGEAQTSNSTAAALPFAFS